ncbi:hypothetical protein LIA77_01482 [Sarocladium implicatum]|nr:hypothetical protein LIA77_01482 [Sarocladium implicatum]
MSVTAEIQTRIAEDIALLHYLGDKPCVPLPPDTFTRSGSQEGRVLSLTTEKELVSDLAYLSSIREDNLKVTAVAVQEVEGSMLRILVAANQTLTSSHEPYLSEIKLGFETLGSVMSRAQRSSRSQLEADMLRAIVKMCSERIVERTKSGDRNSLSSHLEEVMKFVRQVQTTFGSQEFLRRTQQLRVQLEAVPTTGIANNAPEATESKRDKKCIQALEAVIQSCKSMSDDPIIATFLRDDLRVLPKYNPSTASWIRSTIRKIGRYGTCAERLCKIMRQQNTLRRVETVCVSLQEQSLRHVCLQSTTTTDQSIARRVDADLTDEQMAKLRKRRSSYNHNPDRTFRSSLGLAAGSSARIHAEVQLLWYMQSGAVEPRPRVIESHKDACFLCLALISWTGLYVTPRSHGKIYPGWRLPTTRLRNVHETFAIQLETCVTRCMRRLISPKQVPRFVLAEFESSVTVYRGAIDSVLTVCTDPMVKDEVDDAASSGGSQVTIKEVSVAAPSREPGSAQGHGPDDDPALMATPTVKEATGTVQVSLPTPSAERVPSPMPWEVLRAGDSQCVRSCDKLQLFIEMAGEPGDGQSWEVRARVRQLCPLERIHDQRVIDLEEDLSVGDEVQCEPGCKSVFMKVGAQVFVAELEESVITETNGGRDT